MRTPYSHSDATTLVKPCVRSSSAARLEVAVSEYSGLPVTMRSNSAHVSGPIAASAR